MQLLLLLLVFALGGGEGLKGLGPVVEALGDKQLKSALEQAEQLSSVMSVFGVKRGFGGGNCGSDERGGQGGKCERGGQSGAEHCNANGSEHGNTYGAGQSNTYGAEKSNANEAECCNTQGAERGADKDFAPISGLANPEILSALARCFAGEGA